MKDLAKYLILLAVFWLVAPTYGQQARKQPGAAQQVPHDTQHQTYDSVSISTVSIDRLDVKQQIGPEGKPIDDKQPTPSYLRRLIAPETLPNLILCAVGLVGIGFAWRTLNTLITQTKATADAADAAKMSAQAVINSERPWLFIKTSDPGQSPRTAIVTFTFVNRGRTPAEITAHYVDRFFGIPDNFPPVPEYPLAGYELSHKRYLAPEDTFSLDSLNSSDFSDDAWKEANTPNADGRYKWLVFQGHVVYRDLITREQHETRFCYFLSPAPWVGLVLCGPPGYNQHI